MTSFPATIRRFRPVLSVAAVLLSWAFFSAPAQASLVCPLRDPTGSIECVNAGTSWCGNTCRTEPICATVPGSKTQLDCGTCTCSCPVGRTACDGMSSVCQLNNTSCADLNRQSVCATAGDVMTCGACLSGYADCGNVCLPATSSSCPAPKAYDACSGTCREYVIASPVSPQNAFINVTGEVRQGGDLYMSSGRSIRVDGTGTTSLNLANYGGGSFALGVAGNLQATGTVSAGFPTAPTLAAVGDNLIYGVMSDASLGNLLKFEVKTAAGAWLPRFVVSRLGQLTVGDVPWERLSSLPAACADGQFVRGLGASLLCATPAAAPPNGPAGGVLSGTYPNPSLAPNSVILGTHTVGSYVSSVTAGSGLTATPTSGAVSLAVRDPLAVGGLTLGGVTRASWPALDVVTQDISDSTCTNAYHRYSCPAGYVFVGWTGINCAYHGGWACDESQAGPTYVDVVVEKNGTACNDAINIKLRCARLN